MQYLQYLGALALAGAFAWLISNVGRADGSIDRMVAALASLVGGYRGDGWPIGVQEENRDRPWGRGGSVAIVAASDAGGDAAGPLGPADEPAPIQPVRPVIRGSH